MSNTFILNLKDKPFSELMTFVRDGVEALVEIGNRDADTVTRYQEILTSPPKHLTDDADTREFVRLSGELAAALGRKPVEADHE